MPSKRQLPVPVEGPVLTYRNPEEYAAAVKAITWLARITADHIQEAADATEEDNQDDPAAGSDQFLYGQNFEQEPECWEVPESWFHDEGIFGPRDL